MHEKIISVKGLTAKPVADTNGRLLGKIFSVCFNSTVDKIIQIGYTKQTKGKCFLSNPDISYIGTGVVIAAANCKPATGKIGIPFEALKGRPTANVYGMDLGWLTDIYVDEQGNIKTFEFSDGILEDYLHGRYLQSGSLGVGNSVEPLRFMENKAILS